MEEISAESLKNMLTVTPEKILSFEQRFIDVYSSFLNWVLNNQVIMQATTALPCMYGVDVKEEDLHEPVMAKVIYFNADIDELDPNPEQVPTIFLSGERRWDWFSTYSELGCSWLYLTVNPAFKLLKFEFTLPGYKLVDGMEPTEEDNLTAELYYAGKTLYFSQETGIKLQRKLDFELINNPAELLNQATTFLKDVNKFKTLNAILIDHKEYNQEVTTFDNKS